jgi:hypothetical protein
MRIGGQRVPRLERPLGAALLTQRSELIMLAARILANGSISSERKAGSTGYKSEAGLTKIIGREPRLTWLSSLPSQVLIRFFLHGGASAFSHEKVVNLRSPEDWLQV